MKTGIHPTLHHVVFIDSSNGTEFTTLSTLTSEETKKIDGVDHYVIHVDISSASHPFYTGEKMLIDTAGRVDKFKQRMAASEKLKESHQKAQAKKLAKQEESLADKVTRRAKANTLAKAEEKAKKESKKKAAPKATKETEQKTTSKKPETKAKKETKARPKAKKSVAKKEEGAEK